MLSVMKKDDHTEELVVPPPDVLALFVRFQRGMMSWKQATLAAQANVSLSTIQRVERGEPVSRDKLESIGLALGHPPGAFTAPRALRSEEEAAKLAADSFSWLANTVPVKVGPLRKEPQLRALIDTVCGYMDCDLGPEAEDDMSVLREWVNFASFMAATAEGLVTPRPERSFKKRELYADIFRHVQMMERKYRAVCLVGSYEAKSNVESFATLRVGVLCFKSRVLNPAAATVSELRAQPFIDLRRTLRDFIEGGS